MSEHSRRAWRMAEKKIAEHGLVATAEDKFEIVEYALLREDFEHSLDAMIEWAIDFVLLAPKREADRKAS